MTLKIKFFDVQHGSATFIETPNKIHMLHDLGIGNINSNANFSPINYLNNNGINILDYLIITHPDKDHIEDILNINNIVLSVFCRNNNIPMELIDEKINNAQSDYDKSIFLKYKEINSSYNHPVSENNDPTIPKNNGGVEVINFSPEKNDIKDINYYSLTTLISYVGLNVLLMGDNTKGSINELMNNDSFKNKSKNIDILLAPHHGRESCYVSEFVSHLNPRLTVISDKKDDNEVSASHKYSDKSRGWTVYNSRGMSEKRYCLTTRNDGVINVEIGKNNNDSFLYVKI